MQPGSMIMMENTGQLRRKFNQPPLRTSRWVMQSEEVETEAKKTEECTETKVCGYHICQKIRNTLAWITSCSLSNDLWVHTCITICSAKLSTCSFFWVYSLVASSSMAEIMCHSSVQRAVTRAWCKSEKEVKKKCVSRGTHKDNETAPVADWLPDLSLILSYVILRRQQRQKVCNKRRKVHSIV